MNTDEHRSRAIIVLSVLICVYLCPSLCSGGKLSVAIVDAATGKPIPAAVRLYGAEQQLLIPDHALDLRGLGYLYEPGALIHYADWTSPRVRSRDPHFGSSYFRQAHPGMTACFFVAGRFEIELTAGRYRLTVERGMEYLPVERTIAMEGAARQETVRLSRWVDMASRGWYSGDGHVHAQRASADGSRIPLDWAAAEDVHLVNVLAMGDAEQTYYSQYAFGGAGVAARGDTVLLPGQEDPRTQYLGHTLHLNLPALVRDAARYYDYSGVFERARNSGGLSGFAHAGRRRWSFNAERGLSLLAPAGLVDFVEIAQMGYIGVDLWYEFLNLGFRLTAMAGSDVPWGGTIGGPRVYAQIGPGRFSTSAWVEAVRRGRTFVTTGPMLDLTVNGQPPGSVLRVKKGEIIHVRAEAWGDPPGARPLVLELISFGRPLKTVTATPGQKRLEAGMTLEAGHSFWITARGQTNEGQLMDQPGYFSGAIATPVYVEVDGRPAIDSENLPALVERRMQSLDAIEQWLRDGGRGMERGSPAGRESAAALRQSAAAIQSQLRLARDFYLKLNHKGAKSTKAH